MEVENYELEAAFNETREMATLTLRFLWCVQSITSATGERTLLSVRLAAKENTKRMSAVAILSSLTHDCNSPFVIFLQTIL